MATLDEVTDPLVQILLPVPRAGPGVCEVCHRAPRAGYNVCVSCRTVRTQVNHPARLVVPMSLYKVGDQLHTVLRGYKDNRSADVRDRFSLQVAGFIGRFLRDHGDCIRLATDEDWDGIVVVPSTHGRTGPHPLVSALQRISGWDLHLEECLVATGDALEHNRASEAAFSVSTDVSGRRLLLLDDTYTTGAHLHSAASVLETNGATVVVAVTIGRVIDPGFNEENAALLELARRRGFDYTRCCLEAEPR